MYVLGKEVIYNMGIYTEARDGITCERYLSMNVFLDCRHESFD